MAQVILSTREAAGALPDVCMLCGREAAVVKERTFGWHPPWVWITLPLGLLPFAIIAIALTKRATLRVPLCHEHELHWAIRTGFIVTGLGVLVVSAAVCATFATGAVARWCWLGWFSALFGWVVSSIVLTVTSIRPVSITDHEIVIAGVADDFLEALQHWDERRDRRRDYLGPYRLRPLPSEGDVDVPAPHPPRNQPATDEGYIQDKSRRRAPPDDAIRE